DGKRSRKCPRPALLCTGHNYGYVVRHRADVVEDEPSGQTASLRWAGAVRLTQTGTRLAVASVALFARLVHHVVAAGGWWGTGRAWKKGSVELDSTVYRRCALEVAIYPAIIEVLVWIIEN